MPKTPLTYVFPWEQYGPTNEGFSLLDGAIRATVRQNPNAFSALIEPGFNLGDFPTSELAHAAVEQWVTNKINAMLGSILPAEVKRWLMQPL